MKEDMILFDTQTSKTDPSGISTYAKCIASNPFEPHSDVFLGLAFLFFCRDSESDNHLFSYADMPATATIYLRKVLDSFTESEEIVLGCSKNLVGLHTAKKTGCSKLYDNECTVAVAIEKRCDHSLQGSQSCYVGDLPSNDAFNARILAGLPFGTDEFSAKPCHFDGVPHDVWLSIPWSSIIKGYHKFPATCKSVMPFLLATVIHHERFIRFNLRGGGGHAILFSPLFTVHKHLFDTLRPYVKHGVCQSDLTTTGVPLSSKTHAAVHRIERRIANIEAALQRLNVLSDFHVLPPVSSSTCQLDFLADKLDKLLLVLESLAGLCPSSTGGQRLTSKATSWSIGYLPADFRIPPMSVDELWRAWHVASASAPALKSICGKMLPASDNRNNDIRQLSRYGKVIEFITGTTQVSSGDVEASFDELWKQCSDLAVQENVTLGTVNQGAGTFYNTICAHKNLKKALISSTRVALSISARHATTPPCNNGVFFDAMRSNTRLQHPSNAAPADRTPADTPFAATLGDRTPAATTPATTLADTALSMPTNAAASDLPRFQRFSFSPSRAVATSSPSLPSTRPALILPRFSIPTLWNAWWCASEAFDFPLRRLNEVGLLSQYTVKHSESVRFCRFKKVVSYIQSNMSDAMCEEATERSFSTGWSKLSAYLMQKHGIIVKDDAAPSTLYACCNNLGDAFKPTKWSAYQ
jgi:hypothetical protein